MLPRNGLVLLRSKVARRLLAIFLACAGVPMTALAVLTFLAVSDGLREQSRERLHQAAKSSGLLLLERLVTMRDFVQVAAAGSDPERWRPSDVPLPPDTEELVRAATLVRADGRAMPLLGAPVGRLAADLRPVDGMGALDVRAGGDGTQVVVAIPLGEAGAATLLLAVDAGGLLADVVPTALPPHVEHCVAARSGIVLGCSRGDLAGLLPAVPEGHAGSFAAAADEREYLGAYWTLFLDAQLQAESWTIFVLEPGTTAFGALDRFRLLFPLLAVACFGIVFLASVGRIRRQMAPLDRLEDAARIVGQGRFDVSVPVDRDDEFGALAASFNAMAGRLAEQFALLARLVELDREILSANDERTLSASLIDGVDGVHACAAVCVLLAEPDRPGRFSGWLGRKADRSRVLVTVEPSADEAAALRHARGGVLDVELSGAGAGFLAPLAALGGARARVLPLDSAAGPIGLLVLVDPADPSADVALARQVADQAAVALVNARTAEHNRYLAQRDALTGLANRLLFRDRLEQALAAARSSGGVAAVCLLDLDRFKAVNDGLGHAAGDRLLQQVAARLRAHLRGGSLARMGGDEFALLLPGLSTPEACSSIVQRIVDAVDRPFDLDGREIFVTASAGIALYPLDGGDGEELVKQADSAMYEAKRQGGNRLAFYTDALSTRARRRLALESALRRALERDEIVPHYQPVAEVGSRVWVGFEVLARWTSPELGPVAPAEFIAVAEEIGAISALGARILERACRQALAWQSEHGRALHVAVNLSSRQLGERDLPGRVAGVLAETGLDPRLLVLELTESELMEDAVRGREQLAALRRLGVRISIDDFGTGYSSLGYLKEFPIDQLKIDRHFLDGIGDGGVNEAIVRAIAQIGHALGLVVVAEGVEREEQRVALQALGCDLVQGWLLAPALPPEEIAKQLLAGAAAEPDC